MVRRMSMMGLYPMSSSCDDGTSYDIEPVRAEKRNLKANLGNMTKDGYEVVARRPRSQPAGSIMDNEDAARVDAVYSDYESYED